MLPTDLRLPAGYYLEHDPDLLILRRSCGGMVAAFSPLGAADEAIRLAAEEDTRVGPGRLPRVSTPGTGAVEVNLCVRFFGIFELLLSGSPMPPCRNAKALSILKYLLARGGRPVSRDFLMGWLWPDASPKKARWSLNSSVHALRGFLADHLPPGYAEGLILCEEGHYRLHPKLRVTSDVEEFDERYKRGRRLEQEGRMSEAAAEYEASVDLYRDDYLLDDLYEDWTMVERERLSSAYLYMLENLALYYEEIGAPQRGVEVCYRILEKDNCHEGTHRWLIGHYARLGLRERASRQYQSCARALVSRYGVEPSPETRAVYAGVVGGKEVLDVKAGTRASEVPPTCACLQSCVYLYCTSGSE